MPKCNLHIAFDRPERVYEAGEAVTGSVTVVTDDDVKCRALVIEHYWQTHGKGNKDRGPKAVVLRVDAVAWRAGKKHTYPFRLDAPSHPLTYRGRYLNVDHYLHASADIPWALDPKTREEFIVTPGPMVRTRRARPKRFQKSFLAGIPLAAIVAVVVVVGVLSLPLFPFNLVLLPIVGLLMFRPIRNTLAEKKLGGVAARLGSHAAAPGQHLPVEVQFRPKQFVRINRISATLEGKEICVSGSGTNKTTHRHQLHKSTTVISARAAQASGHVVMMDGPLPIPQTGAYSFKANNNGVVWTVSVHVDVADWPDWTQSTSLEIRPDAPRILPHDDVPTAAEDEPGQGGDPILALDLDAPESMVTAAPSLHPPSVPGETLRVDPAPDPPEPEQAGPGMPTTPKPAAPPSGDVTSQAETAGPPSISTADPFETAVNRIAHADRFNGDRERFVEELTGTSFTLVAAVDRVDWTFSFDVAEAYRSGRTVIARTRTGSTVLIRFTSADNEAIDGLKPDMEIEVTGSLAKWDNVHNRPEIDVTSFATR